MFKSSSSSNNSNTTGHLIAHGTTATTTTTMTSYDSIATTRNRNNEGSAPSSSYMDDVNEFKQQQRQQLLSRLSSTQESHQAAEEEEASSTFFTDEDDGTFLRKDWLDIPSEVMSSHKSSSWLSWIINYCCCCFDCSIGDSCCHSFSNIHIERNAVHFGIRMAVLLTISSLFVFYNFREGMWVLITVLFVCWFPRLDSASVVEKSIQRLIGTFIGAAFALSCGFLSLLFLEETSTNAVVDGNGTYIAIETVEVGVVVEEQYQQVQQQPGEMTQGQVNQAIFLATCIFVVTFIVGFCILQFKINGIPIIQKYNYASILCLLTFTIGIFPFYEPPDYSTDINQRWLRAMYRIQNVIIGCILGAFGSMVVLPKSTTTILTEQIHRQIKLAGEASEAVLHEAADTFSGALECIALADELLESSHQKSIRLARQSSRVSFKAVKKNAVVVQGDKVLETYEAALKDWRVTKGVFGILDYDPFNIGIPSHVQSTFKTETANTLARALRIQTTVVLLDGIIRNDPKHNFSDDDLELFAISGTLISRMLCLPFEPGRSEAAAIALTDKLHTIRQMIVTNSGNVAMNPSERELPKVKSKENFDFFVLGSLRGGGSQMNKNGDFVQSNNNNNNNIDDDRAVPKFVPGSHVCALLFLQLVEHLILRSLRLYNSWKKVEDVNKEIKMIQNKLL